MVNGYSDYTSIFDIKNYFYRFVKLFSIKNNYQNLIEMVIKLKSQNSKRVLTNIYVT